MAASLTVSTSGSMSAGANVQRCSSQHQTLSLCSPGRGESWPPHSVARAAVPTFLGNGLQQASLHTNTSPFPSDCLACGANVIYKHTGRFASRRLLTRLHTEVKCQSLGAESASGSPQSGGDKSPAEPGNLQIGTPIVIVEAPPFIKSAEPMPMLRENKGQIKVGDVGRIMDRRPKGVWAVRFTTGAFLVDRKYFQWIGVTDFRIEQA